MKPFIYPEGATPLDANELDGLKLKHLTTQAELNRWEQDNISEAMQWTSRMRRTDILSEAFLCDLHHRMFGKVWQWAGTFRRSDKNIGAPWMRVPQEFYVLLKDVQYWVAHQTYDPDEIAYRFHHRLVQIHLFANGNGRHARLATDLLLTKILKTVPFTWGRGSLTEATHVRKVYIAALRQADGHDYTALKAFVRS